MTSSLLGLLLLFLNVFDSFKTLKTPPPSRRRNASGSRRPSARATSIRKREMKATLCLWVVWAFWTYCVKIADKFIGFFPFYSELKSFILIFLLLTRKSGAHPIVLHVIKPLIRPYTDTLDALLEFAEGWGEVIQYLVQSTLSWIQSYWKGHSDDEVDGFVAVPGVDDTTLKQAPPLESDTSSSHSYPPPPLARHTSQSKPMVQRANSANSVKSTDGPKVRTRKRGEISSLVVPPAAAEPNPRVEMPVPEATTEPQDAEQDDAYMPGGAAFLYVPPSPEPESKTADATNGHEPPTPEMGGRGMPGSPLFPGTFLPMPMPMPIPMPSFTEVPVPSEPAPAIQPSPAPSTKSFVLPYEPAPAPVVPITADIPQVLARPTSRSSLRTNSSLSIRTASSTSLRARRSNTRLPGPANGGIKGKAEGRPGVTRTRSTRSREQEQRASVQGFDEPLASGGSGAGGFASGMDVDEGRAGSGSANGNGHGHEMMVDGVGDEKVEVPVKRKIESARETRESTRRRTGAAVPDVAGAGKIAPGNGESKGRPYGNPAASSSSLSVASRTRTRAPAHPAPLAPTNERPRGGAQRQSAESRKSSSNVSISSRSARSKNGPPERSSISVFGQEVSVPTRSPRPRGSGGAPVEALRVDSRAGTRRRELIEVAVGSWEVSTHSESDSDDSGSGSDSDSDILRDELATPIHKTHYGAQQQRRRGDGAPAGLEAAMMSFAPVPVPVDPRVTRRGSGQQPSYPPGAVGMNGGTRSRAPPQARDSTHAGSGAPPVRRTNSVASAQPPTGRRDRGDGTARMRT